MSLLLNIRTVAVVVFWYQLKTGREDRCLSVTLNFREAMRGISLWLPKYICLYGDNLILCIEKIPWIKHICSE